MYSQILISLIVLSSSALTVLAIAAPFANCKDRPPSAINVTVDVNPCTLNSNNTCELIIGNKANFTLEFTSQTTINGSIERLIMAKFNKQMNGKDVDVTYGGPVPSGNTTFDALTLVPVEGQSLIAGRRYIHNDMFDVLENAPKTTLTVRYLIRETKPCQKSKCNFIRHSGDMLVCVEIPISLV